MKKELLDILVCPVCNGKLTYLKQRPTLLCKFDRLAYPFDQGIPVLLEERASQLSSDEISELLRSA